MSERGVVRRRSDGRHVLHQRAVFVGFHDPLYLEWAAEHTNHLLKTALENWKERNPNARQLDRIARVFDLPEQEWIATRAIQYINTAFANCKERNSRSRQLDRIARVFDLPEKEIRHFREFSKSCSESWIAQIDNWLEDHSAPKGRQRRVEAGIHVYGYVGRSQKIAAT